MPKILFFVIVFLTIPVGVVVVITPMDVNKQTVFSIVVLSSFLLLGLNKKRVTTIVMIVLSTLISARYIWWRTTSTLHFNSDTELILGSGLYLAELYVFVVLIFGYIQTAWPLKRKIIPLPEDMHLWPTVDIFIPTYNEDIQVVRDTILAAQCIDYPEKKLNIYLLDDGKRQEFAVFATQAGVGYLTREDNNHAKAGNLNNALKFTKGEFICVFDCDHVATRNFLQATLGPFVKDSRLALLQTPHFFYSPDPFERNLSVAKNVPNEGALFYGPVQQGNDNWNATFFCGSCAVIRREALEEIGGFAVETVTEDAHTALKMQRLGWGSAFISVPLAAGLATERLGLHIIQRTRWARGMTQIFRVDNPLVGRGLTWQQRICYVNAMLHFQFGLPRFILLTAPLTYLIFNINIIYSSASLILSYVIPHLIISIMINHRINGKYRYTFWGEIYETVMCFHLIIPMLLAFISAKRGKFNVTDKGGLLDKGFFDCNIVRPHIFTATVIFVGIIYGVIKSVKFEYFGVDPYVCGLNIAWSVFNLIILICAISVARETKQKRKYARVNVSIPAIVRFRNGCCLRTETINLSMGGALIKKPLIKGLGGDIISLDLILKSFTINIPIYFITGDEFVMRFKFDEMSIGQRRELVRIVLGRADAWIEPPHPAENPMKSLLVVSNMAFVFILSIINKGLSYSRNNLRS